MASESTTDAAVNAQPIPNAKPKRPLIGLTGRRRLVGELNGFPESLHHLDTDLYFTGYARAVWQAGGMPVHLPVMVELSDWTDYLDGIVFSGGADVEPSLYGHDNIASAVEPERDEMELALFEAARSARLPMLGICRGFQLFNVAMGGTLHQEVPAHSRYDLDPAKAVHDVQIVPGSILHGIYGDSIHTNTLHHQTIDQVGEGIVVTARTTDGTPEGIELVDLPAIAVQWHPEMMNDDLAAFDWLVGQAAPPSARPD